jgi:hypothetical protein
VEIADVARANPGEAEICVGYFAVSDGVIELGNGMNDEYDKTLKVLLHD